MRLFNGTTFFLSGHYWEAADAPSLGGSSTTVNIGGGGTGLQLGVTAKDTITTSTTITADDLSGTGPAWVLLGGGGGSGAVAQYNSCLLYTSPSPRDS